MILLARQRNWPSPGSLGCSLSAVIRFSTSDRNRPGFMPEILNGTPSCVAARRVVRADLGGGASARLSSSFTAEDDRYVDDRDRRHRQQDDDEANRRIDQVRPDREGSAND